MMIEWEYVAGSAYGLFLPFVRILASLFDCNAFRNIGSVSANQAISSRFVIGPSRHVSQYVFMRPLPCNHRAQ